MGLFGTRQDKRLLRQPTCICTLILTALSIAPPALSDDLALVRWMTKAPVPDSPAIPPVQTRFYGAAASVIDGKIYLSHGDRCNQFGCVPVRDAWAYDPALNAWSMLGAAPRFGGESAGTSLGTLHFALGGRDSVFVPGIFFRSRNVQIFDSANGAWSLGPEMLSARERFCSVTADSKIHAIGGDVEGRTHEVFDPGTQTWAPSAPLPVSVRYNQACVALNDKIYVFGGQDFYGNYTGHNQIYDLASDSWSLGAPMPTPRAAALAGPLGGKAVVVGGESWSAIVDVYDPTCDVWMSGPFKPTSGSSFASSMTVAGNALYAIGGGTPATEALVALPPPPLVLEPVAQTTAPAIFDPTGDVGSAPNSPGVDIRLVEFQDDGLTKQAVDLFMAGNIPSNGAVYRVHIDSDCNTGQVACGETTSDLTLKLTMKRGQVLVTGADAGSVRDTNWDGLPDAVRLEISLPAMELNARDANPGEVCVFADTLLSTRRMMTVSDYSPNLLPANTSTKPCFQEEVRRFRRAIRPSHLATAPGNRQIIALEQETALNRTLRNVAPPSMSDLALSPDAQTLFVSLGFGQQESGFQGDGRIFRFSTADNTFSGCPRPSGWASVPALTFAPDGTLYGTATNSAPPGGADFDPDYFLVTIDPATLVTEQVGGQIGIDYIDSLAFLNGRMYATGWGRGEQAVLAEIDPATGRGRIIGNIGVSFVAGLAPGPNGMLLGSTGGFDENPGTLLLIDPSSGKSSAIGPTGFRAVSGLTKLPGVP